MKTLLKIGCLALVALAGNASAQVTPSDRWTYRATLYGFFPSVLVEADTHLDAGRISTEREPNEYLKNLQGTFMGAFEARRHPWSVQLDFIYLNFGHLNSRVTSIGDADGNGLEIPVQANTNTDLEGGLTTAAVGYAIANTETNTLDALAGVRYVRLKTAIEWEFSGPVGAFPVRGNAERTKDIVDAVVGFRGRFIVGKDKWFVPWYFDVGTGTSRYTYQVMAGAGYRFGWGDVALAYRHLAYKFGDDVGVREMVFSGPILGATFRF